jgi:hypothetical protein
MYSKAGSMAGTARLKLEQLVHPSDMPSLQALIYRVGYMSYEEEDTCHMRRRMHVVIASLDIQGRIHVI